MARRIKENDGFVLITMLVFSVLLTMIGLSVIVLSTTEVMISYNNMLEGGTFYVAEGGLENQIADLNDISQGRAIPTPEELMSISQVPPSFDNYTFSEYGVERMGDAYLQTITMGPYAGLYALVQPYRMFSGVVGPDDAKIHIERSSQHHLIPVFQYGVFYDKDLEILPGPTMTFGGRVHTNEDLYVGANSDLYFDSFVTSAGSIFHERKEEPVVQGGDVWFRDDEGEYRKMTQDSRYPEWEEWAIVRWGGRVRDQAHGIVRLGLPLPAGVEPIEIIKRGREDDSEALIVSRFYYKAGLKIIDGVATDGNDEPVVLDEDILSTQTFYNFREEKWVTATQIDIKVLSTSGQSPENGIIYISESETSPGARDAVIRLVNGEKIPSGGLTVATDNPLYIQGDYNVQNFQPASVLTDAINILSNSWDDADSDKPLNQRVASSTSVRVAIMAGNLETTTSHYNGGLENFLRFLEKWTGQTMTYQGAIVCMWYSEWATGQWYYGGNSYKAPRRDWSYDTEFYNPDMLPPGCPNILNFEPGEWIYE